MGIGVRAMTHMITKKFIFVLQGLAGYHFYPINTGKNLVLKTGNIVYEIKK